jgi:hypothetical protein
MLRIASGHPGAFHRNTKRGKDSCRPDVLFEPSQVGVLFAEDKLTLSQVGCLSSDRVDIREQRENILFGEERSKYCSNL